MTTQLRQEIVTTAVDTLLSGNGFRMCLLKRGRRIGITQALVTALGNSKTKLHGIVVCAKDDATNYRSAGVDVITLDEWWSIHKRPFEHDYDFCIVDGGFHLEPPPKARMQLFVIDRKIWDDDTAEGERLRRRCANFTQIDVE